MALPQVPLQPIKQVVTPGEMRIALVGGIPDEGGVGGRTLLRGCSQIENHSLNTSSDLSKSSISVFPYGYRFFVRWQNREMGKGGHLPIHRTDQDRNHTSITRFMPLHCSLHLNAKARLRGQ